MLLKLRILFGDLLPGDPVTGKLFDHGGDVIQGHSNLEGGVSLAESGREGFLKDLQNQNNIQIGTVCGYKFNHLVAKLTTLTVSRSASFKDNDEV